MANKLIVSAAPHITSADSTSKIMGRVCIALLPTLIASVLIFGFQALLLTAVTVAACVVFEYACCWPSTCPPVCRCGCPWWARSSPS